MNLRDPNMAASEVSNSMSEAPPSRPANLVVKPNELAPDAQFSTAISEVKPSKSPRSKRPAISSTEPKCRAPGAPPILGNEGDETNACAQPKTTPSRRNSPRKGSSQATKLEAPISKAPDCINPAKAGGIDHALCVTQDHSVDANLSREGGGKGAQRTTANHADDSPLADSSGESRGIDHHARATHGEAVDANFLPGISPDQSKYETQQQVVGAGDQGAHRRFETPGTHSPLIAEITQLVRMRRRWHKAEKSLTLQGKALCRSWTNGDKDEANAAYDRAADGKPDDPMLAMALAPFLDAKARFETDRRAIEKTLRKLARTLPVWKAWAEGVKGLGDLRLAVIVGECGDIGSYRNPSCFWKRMGLAVIGGQRQRRVTDAAEALEHGYNPDRRAIAYVMSTELIKAQVRRIKDAPETALRPAIDVVEPNGQSPDATPSIAIGPYGQLYLDRKVYEAGREGITKAHANNRASRYLAKRVLRDLYSAWRAA